jgi:hypothetical protein
MSEYWRLDSDAPSTLCKHVGDVPCSHALLMSERFARMFEHSLEHLWRKTGDVAGHGCADVEGEDKSSCGGAFNLQLPNSKSDTPVVEYYTPNTKYALT